MSKNQGSTTDKHSTLIETNSAFLRGQGVSPDKAKAQATKEVNEHFKKTGQKKSK